MGIAKTIDELKTGKAAMAQIQGNLAESAKRAHNASALEKKFEAHQKFLLEKFGVKEGDNMDIVTLIDLIHKIVKETIYDNEIGKDQQRPNTGLATPLEKRPSYISMDPPDRTAKRT